MDSIGGDGNDLIYDQYGIDLVGLVRYLLEGIFQSDASGIIAFLNTVWNVYSVIAMLLSAIFFGFFIYAKVRFEALAAEEQRRLREGEDMWAERYGGEESAPHGRWAEIQAHLREDNPNSWKIAIIEADIFLESILTDNGYVGSTIGEKLKSANTASFTTIQDAWEAHKVRNEIAHAGQNDYILTRRVAQETILRYERVFREFGALSTKKSEEETDSHGH